MSGEGTTGRPTPKRLRELREDDRGYDWRAVRNPSWRNTYCEREMTELIIKVDKEKFGNLMYALDRAEEKGYLPDAIAEEWSAFEWEITLAASAPNPSDKQEADDALETLVAVLNAISYTEEFAEAHPTLKVSEGVKLFLAQSAEQDRIDAERYRFLRDKMRFSSPPGDIPTMTLIAPLEVPTHDTHKDWISDRFDASVDRTIDAAMEREND
jgi:hypothetical protein